MAAVIVLLVALWMGTLFQFCHATTYTNDWAIRIRGDVESVNRIAEKYGFTNMRQVSLIKAATGVDTINIFCFQWPSLFM